MASAGEIEQAQQVRDEAFEAAPATHGVIDDQPFEWIADADARLGPMLEAIVNGRYYWVPFDRIREIRIEAPADLRDAVWTPAYFTWANGGETVGLIPTRYPGTEASSRSEAALGAAHRVGRARRRALRRPRPAHAGDRRRRIPADGRAHDTARERGRGRRARLGATGRECLTGWGMAELTQQERLQPSLLDRLTDDEPEKKQESREKRVVSLRRLREGVLRDLAWLLNTSNLAVLEDLDRLSRMSRARC